MQRAVAFFVVLLMVCTSCRTLRSDGVSAANNSSDSGNSSAGSNDSSKTSNDSSQNSNESSKNSNNSFQSKNEAGQSSSQPSSEASSKNTTVAFLSATTVGGTVVGIGLLIWKLAARKPDREKASIAAHAFLKMHGLQLEQDLALGSGPVLADLAHAAEIRREHFGDFARLLRTHRSELLQLAAAESLTPERALAFLERIGAIAREHPVLATDYEAFAARHADEG